jgi:hypothetical protein
MNAAFFDLEAGVSAKLSQSYLDASVRYPPTLSIRPFDC